MMGNDRPCDLCVLLDYAILAYALLKVEFFTRPVYSPKHNTYVVILIQAAGFVGFHNLILLVFGCSLQMFFQSTA